MAYNQTKGASFNNGDVGSLTLGVRIQTNDLFSTSGTSLYQPIIFDTAGNLRVNVVQQAGGGSSVTVTSASNVLAVNIVTDSVGIGGGIQFGDCTTSTNITGTAIMAVGSDNVVRYASIDSARLLQVDIAADSVGIGGGIQFGDGTTSTNVTGTAIMGVSSANVVRYIAIDGNRYQYVNLGTSSGLLTVSAINSSFNISSAANIITVSHTNASFVISSGSNILSVSNVNNAIQISSAANIITVSATNSSFVVSSASNYLATRYDGSNYPSTATYTTLSATTETVI